MKIHKLAALLSAALLLAACGKTDVSEEDLDELEGQWKETSTEDMEVYSLKKAGKYAVNVPYMTESGENDEIIAEFEVK